MSIGCCDDGASILGVSRPIDAESTESKSEILKPYGDIRVSWEQDPSIELLADLNWLL